MKNSKKLALGVAVACLILATGSVIAQDSAAINIAKEAVGYAEGKWPVTAKIAGAVATLSELLALIPSSTVKANGILDFLIKFIQGTFGKT